MKKILVVVYFDYHLYGFIEPLLKVLAKTDSSITFLTCDIHLQKKINNISNVDVLYLPHIGRIINIMNYRFLRPFGWFYGWLWSAITTRKFNLVITPTDNKPFYHMITSWIPSLICQNGLGNYDKQYLRYKYRGDIPMPNPNRYLLGRHKVVDRILGGSYCGKIRGPLKLKHYTVTGPDIGSFLGILGVPKEHIHSVGNPNYHELRPQPLKINALMQKLGLSENENLYIFFSSQLEFFEEELKNLYAYIERIFEYDSHARFCLKVHPRVKNEHFRRLKKWAAVNQKIILLTDIYGDECNLQLIALAHAVVVEDSNVALLAAHHQKPLMIIDIGSTKYTDDSFLLYYGDLADCTNLECLQENFFQAHTPSLLAAQNKMAERICLANSFPCTDIANLCEKLLQK